MKVLIAVDPSPSSQDVISEAAARPWPAHTSFLLVHVVDLQRFAKVPMLLDDAEREGKQALTSGVATLARSGHTAESELSVGFPRKAISERAREWRGELIMLGSHALSALGRFLLGSVAQAVLRSAPCSVEIVRPAATGPASSHAMKILLASDGSACSIAAAHALAKRPWPAGTVVKVLSVEELMVLENQFNASSLSAIYPASLLEELVRDAHDRAKSAVETAKKILVDAGLRAVCDPAAPLGEPRAVILDAAKAWQADMIVLGSHGLRGLDRLLMGSVSEAVAMHAHCSVEVVRAA
ncbi:MAG: universal stress protein [Candidatus Acidiferrum sp.]